jgi:hypothetical protein
MRASIIYRSCVREQEPRAERSDELGYAMTFNRDPEPSHPSDRRTSLDHSGCSRPGHNYVPSSGTRFKRVFVHPNSCSVKYLADDNGDKFDACLMERAKVGYRSEPNMKSLARLM